MKKGFLLGTPPRKKAPDKREGVASPKLGVLRDAAVRKYGSNAHANAEKQTLKMPANPEEVTIDRGYTEDFPHEKFIEFFESVRDTMDLKALCTGEIPYDQPIAPKEVTDAITRPVTVTIKPGFEVDTSAPMDMKHIQFFAAREYINRTSYGAVLQYDCCDSDFELLRKNKEVTSLHYCLVDDEGVLHPSAQAHSFAAEFYTESQDAKMKFDCINVGYYFSRFSVNEDLLRSMIQHFSGLLHKNGRLTFTLATGDLDSVNSPLATLGYRMENGFYPMVLARMTDNRTFCDYSIPLDSVGRIVNSLPGFFLNVVSTKDYKNNKREPDAVTILEVKPRVPISKTDYHTNQASEHSTSEIIDAKSIHVSLSSATNPDDNNIKRDDSDNNNNNTNVNSSRHSIPNDPILRQDNTLTDLYTISGHPSNKTEVINDRNLIEKITKELRASSLHNCYPRDMRYSDMGDLNSSRLYYTVRPSGLHGIVFGSIHTLRTILAIDSLHYRYIDLPRPAYPIIVSALNIEDLASDRAVVAQLVAFDCTYPSGLLGRVSYLRKTCSLPQQTWRSIIRLADDHAQWWADLPDFRGLYVGDAASAMNKYDPLVERNIYPVFFVAPKKEYVVITPSAKVIFSLPVNKYREREIRASRVVAVYGDGFAMPTSTYIDDTGQYAKAHSIDKDEREVQPCVTVDSMLFLSSSLMQGYRWTQPLIKFDMDKMFPGVTSINQISCEIGSMEKLLATYPHYMKWDAVSAEERFSLYSLRHARYKTVPGSSVTSAAFLNIARQTIDYIFTVEKKRKGRVTETHMPVDNG